MAAAKRRTSPTRVSAKGAKARRRVGVPGTHRAAVPTMSDEQLQRNIRRVMRRLAAIIRRAPRALRETVELLPRPAVRS